MKNPPNLNLCLRSCFRVSLLMLGLLSATSAWAQEPAIQWELANPFRFIHDQQTIDELKIVYAGLTVKSAATLERALQDKSDADARKQRAAATHCDHPTPEERRQCFAPYAGWFAKLAEENYRQKTCWDSRKTAHKYRTDGPCADYIYPRSHKVRVWIANAESLGGTPPQWSVQPQLTSAPCPESFGKRFCIEFDIPYIAEHPAPIQVTAGFPNSTLTTNPAIKVEDKLVVGLGDSFASGEGNPDVPATFIDADQPHQQDTDILAAKFAGNHITHYPRKDKGNEAVWLDKRCHRSMYSYQFKTALQLALRDPQQAITFVSFSCSGAVTNHIIGSEQKANEGGDSLPPQLQALRETLWNGGDEPLRKIDFLLLSTGGNDVGFADFVAYILVRQSIFLDALKIFKKVSAEKMEDGFRNDKFRNELLGTETKPGNYRRLQTALFGADSDAKPLRISNERCPDGRPCRILLTTYPDALQDENGAICRGDRLEFDEAFGADNERRALRIDTVSKFVFPQIKKVQAEVNDQLGWTLIDGNVAAYAKHGFCSRNTLSQSIGEKFQLPTWVNKTWLNFDPRNYKAYESRSRWFRLPVDAKLTTDQGHKILGIRVDVLLEDMTSNIMHPTAEGLAVTADLNVEAIRRIGP
jgi:hypothetical protein